MMRCMSRWGCQQRRSRRADSGAPWFGDQWELTALESIERRADDNRRVRYAVAVGFVSVVAIPASLILAYLEINASQSIDNAHGGGAALPMATWYLQNEITRFLTDAAIPLAVT